MYSSDSDGTQKYSHNSAFGRSSILPFVASVTNPQTVTGPKKILVVDDSLVIRKTLAMKLKGSGYLVIEAADGAGAVSTVRRELLVVHTGRKPRNRHASRPYSEGSPFVQEEEETKTGSDA